MFLYGFVVVSIFKRNVVLGRASKLVTRTQRGMAVVVGPFCFFFARFRAHGLVCILALQTWLTNLVDSRHIVFTEDFRRVCYFLLVFSDPMVGWLVGWYVY